MPFRPLRDNRSYAPERKRKCHVFTGYFWDQLPHVCVSDEEQIEGPLSMVNALSCLGSDRTHARDPRSLESSHATFTIVIARKNADKGRSTCGSFYPLQVRS